MNKNSVKTSKCKTFFYFNVQKSVTSTYMYTDSGKVKINVCKNKGEKEVV